MPANPYRSLPSVDHLLARDDLQGLGAAAKPLVRRALEAARGAITSGARPPEEWQIAEQVLRLARLVLEPSLRPVINATGVIIHTNLGRAPLSEDAITAMAAASRSYSNLEFDIDTGSRSSRHEHIGEVLAHLTGADGALVVNNNAAALLLVLSTLSARHQGEGTDAEVIISRGQAVEIGGGFRIPDLMAQSGIKLVEVGTTNRTYLRDYGEAITPNTAAIIRVHTSNFRVVGFTEQPGIGDLARVAHEHGVFLVDDLGSGCLLDTIQFGLAAEPTVAESIQAGADIVMFSGDKLLGGPQAGVVLGRRELIDEAKRHHLARALRVDKATIAGLHATLVHYLRGEALSKIPVWQMIAAPVTEIESRANAWKKALGSTAAVVDARSMVGGGSLPEESLPTKAVSIPGEGAAIAEMARRLRTGGVPVIPRVERDALLLDPRTVAPAEDQRLLEAIQNALLPAKPTGWI